MQFSAIGETTVSVLGLGTGRLMSLGTRRSMADVRDLVDVAAEVGINFIDTSDTYGSTACERALGDVLRGHRADFVVATKGGLATVDLPRTLRAGNQLAKKALVWSGRRHQVAPTTMARRIDASLSRLQRDAIDIYFLHAPPREAIENLELLAVLRDAVSAGKIRALGVSSDDPSVLEAARHSGSFSVLQTSGSNLVSLTPDIGGTAIVVNQILSATPPDVRSAAERVAADQGSSLTAVLLRNAAALPDARAVLVGTVDPDHLRRNAAAFEVPVSQSDRLST